MTDQTNKAQSSTESSEIRSSDLEKLLDDLYSLQDNLLSDNVEKALANTDLQLPDSLSEDDVHNLEIPILSDVVDDEVDGEKLLSDQFNQAQQHLFEKPSATQPSTQWAEQRPDQRRGQQTHEQNAPANRPAAAGEDSQPSGRAI